MRGGSANFYYYKVKLNLEFIKDESPLQQGQPNHMNSEEWEEICSDYEQTEEYYSTHSIEDTIKNDYDPKEFVEFLSYDYEILRANWVPDEFAVEIIIKTSEPNIDTIKEEYLTTSLEDGEYESSSSNGWVMTTFNENWVYGVTDYRKEGSIHVEAIRPSMLGGRRRKSRKASRKTNRKSKSTRKSSRN